MENNWVTYLVYAFIAFVVYQILVSCNVVSKIFGKTNIQQGGQDMDAAKQSVFEKISQNVSSGPDYDLDATVKPHQETQSQLYDYNYQVLPYPQISTNSSDSYFSTGGVCQPSDPGCYSGSTLQAPDLLPQEQGNNAWNETSPRSQGHITDQNFLESGHHFGINTVGQSLKNANRQLRSDPPIPKVNVGPWNNSTIDPDTNRKAFEIEQ